MATGYTNLSQVIRDTVDTTKCLNEQSIQIRRKIFYCNAHISYVCKMLIELADECNILCHGIKNGSTRIKGSFDSVTKLASRINKVEDEARDNRASFTAYGGEYLKCLDEGFDNLESFKKFSKIVGSRIKISMDINEEVLKSGSNLFDQLELQK